MNKHDWCYLCKKFNVFLFSMHKVKDDLFRKIENNIILNLQNRNYRQNPNFR